MKPTPIEKKSVSKTTKTKIAQKQNDLSEINQKQLQNIFQHVPAATAVLEGPEHRYILANKAYQKLFNRQAKDFLGKSIYEVFPELKDSGAFELVDRVFETGESFTTPEYALLVDAHHDGVLRQNFYEFSMEPLKNDSGEIYAVIAMIYDITEQVESRKKVEASEKRYNMMLMQSPFAIAVLKGKDMVVAMANDSIKQMWGKGNNIEGKPMLEVLPEIIDQEFPALLDKVYTTGNAYVVNEALARLNRKGKKEDVYFNYVYQPYRETDDTISGITIIAIEVTEQVLAQKKIEENEKQQAFLLKLSDALRTLSDPVEIEGTATKIALDFMDADWCHYDTIEGDNLIIQRGASREGFPSLAGVYPISSFSLFKTVINSGIPCIIDDVHTTDILDEDLRQLCIQLQNIAIVIVPVNKNDKPVGLLVLVQSKPRKWSEVEVKLTIETAERIWAAVERAKAEEALSISEEKYRTLFTSMDQGFTLCELIRNKEGKGIDFYILEVNSTYEKQTGISKEMVLGKSLLAVIPSLGKWMGSFAAVVHNQRPVELETYLDETDSWFAIKAYPVEKERFAILYSNITERKQAEEKLIKSEERFRNLAETLPQMVWVRDGDGRFEYGSKNWKVYSGIDDVEEAWNYMIQPDDRERLTAIWNKAFTQGKGYHHEVQLKSKEGIYRWFYSVGEPVLDADGKVSKWVGSLSDIHEQKNIEEILEKEVAKRTKELEQKNTELQNMNNELEAFNYISSHDLQEPLRKIQTFAGRIIANEKAQLSDTTKDYFIRMQDAANRMQSLIQDLLLFSRVSKSERKFEITGMSKMVDEVKEELKEVIAEKKAFIEATEHCDVYVIPFQFRQLMHNLISNTLKFSKADVPPRIIIKSIIAKGLQLNNDRLLPDTKYCYISFADNGIGFDKSFSEKIFGLFQRLHTKEEYAGTGIGLAIVKKIVDNHNGIVTAESELGKGATFNIYLPYIQSQPMSMP